MLRYEILILATPEITQDEGKKLESHIDEVIRAAQASMISFERWGKYRLAYPVKKNDYGVYYLARFEGEHIGSLIENIKNLFKIKLYDVVMRNMITRLDNTESLNYQRPPSLEEAPPREVGSFLTDSFAGSKRKRAHEDWESDEEQSPLEEELEGDDMMNKVSDSKTEPEYD